MRILFSVVSLLVVVAIVGVMASRQLKAVATPSVAMPAASATSPAATPREQSRQLQEQIQRDINQALEQGARKADPEQ